LHAPTKRREIENHRWNGSLGISSAIAARVPVPGLIYRCSRPTASLVHRRIVSAIGFLGVTRVVAADMRAHPTLSSHGLKKEENQ
jgi:hypothetical protein